MKQLITILFLMLISCNNSSKSSIKTINGIDSSVYEIWNSFIKSNPQFNKEKLPNTDFFHNNEADANRLAELIVNGKKTASSSLYYWYKQANADLPQIGTKLIVTNFNGKAQAIIETKKVDTIPFDQISKKYAAMDMGTTIDPLKKWKKAHWDFFKNAMKENQESPTKKMLIVCEIFETIWTKNDRYNNKK